MAAPYVSAQVIILDLPDLLLQPNKPNQTFDLYAENQSSDFLLTGLRIELMVGDGGPEAGGSISGPAISDVSVTSPGTLFAPSNIGERGVGSIVPQLFERSTLTPSGTVTLLGGTSTKIATMTFDTTGFGFGTSVGYTLDTLNGPTVFHTPSGDFQPQLFDGTLTVIPEPSHYAAAAAGACLVWAALRRRKLRHSASS
jgi:hypothetical protein